jgi:hypothetical protein
MNRKMMAGSALAGIVAAGILWIGGGCETIEMLDQVLILSPSSTNLTVESQTVVFNVTVNAQTNSTGTGTNALTATAPVVLPFRWFVSDASLGAIQAAGAYSAVYERNGEAEGNNYVRVQDAAGRYEAVATISQTTPEEDDDDAGNVVTNAP